MNGRIFNYLKNLHCGYRNGCRNQPPPLAPFAFLLWWKVSLWQGDGMRGSFPTQTNLWFHDFHSFSLVQDIKEKGWSMFLFQRLIKPIKGAELSASFASQFANRNIKLLYYGKIKQGPDFHLQQTRHCTDYHPIQHWTAQVSVLDYRFSPTPLFLLPKNPNQNGSVCFWLGGSLFHTKNSQV